MEVKSPDLEPSSSCCSSNHQEGSVQVTKLPQPRFSGEQRKSHLPEFSVDLQSTQWSGQLSREEFHPCWDNTKRSFHHHCNNQREDELNKQNLDWKHFLSYFQIFTFRRWLRWQHKSVTWVNVLPKRVLKFCFFLSFQGGIPRNFHSQMCPKKAPQNCLISATKAHEFVE